MIPTSTIVATVRDELNRREDMARITNTQQTSEPELQIWRAAVDLLTWCEAHGITTRSGRPQRYG